MATRLIMHLRGHWVAWMAIGLLAAGSGGAAYALKGKNTVRSDDIKNGAVKLKDLAPKARPKPSPVRSINFSGQNTDAESARHTLVATNGVTLSARCDTSSHSGVSVHLFARNRNTGSVRIGDSVIEDVNNLGPADTSAETVSVAPGAEKEIDADQTTDLHITGTDTGGTAQTQAQLVIRSGSRVSVVELHIHANGLVNPATCELFGIATRG